MSIVNDMALQTKAHEQSDMFSPSGKGYLTLDPRTKLLILLFINLFIFNLPALTVEWICVGMIVLLLLLMGYVSHALRYLAFYVGVLLCWQIVPYLPEFLGVIVGVFVLFVRKVWPIIAYASVVISSTHVSELIAGLQAMRMPKVIVVSLAVMFRFFPTAQEEIHALNDAMRLRGIQLSWRNLLTRPLVMLESLLVPMMLRAALIAEELAAAAITRGIDSDHPRTSLWQLRLRWSDYAIAAAFFLLALFEISGGEAWLR